MKALVYNGPGSRIWRDVPDPVIQDPEDAIIRVDAVTICGTDLHILKGDVPTVDSGRILGHEAVGTVEAVGDGVRGLSRRPGADLLHHACGRCRYCREGHYGQCLGGGGWILGHQIDGTQAEKVRVPFADRSCTYVPDNVSSEDAVLLADILPTSYEVGVLTGQVAGRHGRHRRRRTDRSRGIHDGQAVQPGAHRRDRPGGARGRRLLEVRRRPRLRPRRRRRAARSEPDRRAGRGCRDRGGRHPGDVRGLHRLVRAGGRVANVGVHGAPATLHLEIALDPQRHHHHGSGRHLLDPDLLRACSQPAAQAACGLVTHRFGLDEMQDAYDVFSRPAETGALESRAVHRRVVASCNRLTDAH